MKQQHIFDKYNSEDEINQAILQLTAKMNQAPESINLSEAVFSFQKSIDGAETAEQLYLQNDMTVSSLIVMNEQEGNGGGYAEYLRNVMDRAAFSELTAQGLSITLNFERTLLPNYKKPQITISEAKEKAETVVKKLGLDTFSCSGERMVALIDPTAVTPNAEIYGLYEFMFTRNVSGCNITYTNDDISADPNNEAVYRKPWRYEKVRVFIDDKGIFAFFWNAPYEVREVKQDIVYLRQKALLLQRNAVLTGDWSYYAQLLDIQDRIRCHKEILEKYPYDGKSTFEELLKKD